MKRATWLVLFFSLATATGAMACARARPGGSADAGPSGPRPAGSMGVLTVRMSEEIDAGTCVKVYVPGYFTSDRFPGAFPARIALPMDETTLVEAQCPGFRLFTTKRTLTRANPEAEVTIPLEEAQPRWAYGYRPSELPKDTGFIPVKDRDIGRPAARVFEWISGPPDPDGLVVDERAEVWLFRIPDGGNDFEFRRRGLIVKETFGRMKALRQEADQGEVTTAGWCKDWDCNDCRWGSAIYMYDAAHWGSVNVLLAASGSATNSRRTGAAPDTLTRWMLGVWRDAVWLDR